MLQFGIAALTVTGKPIARINNVAVNITYDSSPLRGGSRIFPDHIALYNGNVEGTFENGELVLSAIADMLGGTFAGAAGSGTLSVSSTQVLTTGLDLVVSAVTNGVTGTLTFFNCFFPSLSFTIDRENYTMPSTNFIVAGESSASGGRVWSFQA